MRKSSLFSMMSLLFSGLGESLVGKSVGFLGLGRIGLAIAKRLIPFGIRKVYYTNRTDNKEAEREVGRNEQNKNISFDLLSRSELRG